MQQKKSRLKPALITSILPAGRLAIKTEACRRVPKRRLFLFSVNALQSCTLSFSNVFTSSSNWFYCPWWTEIQGPALKWTRSHQRSIPALTFLHGRVWAHVGDWQLLCTPERDWMSFFTTPQDDQFIQPSTWSSWKLSKSLLVQRTIEFLTVCLIRTPLLWHIDFNICIVSIQKLQNESYCRKEEIQ